MQQLLEHHQKDLLQELLVGQMGCLMQLGLGQRGYLVLVLLWDHQMDSKRLVEQRGLQPWLVQQLEHQRGLLWVLVLVLVEQMDFLLVLEGQMDLKLLREHQMSVVQ